MPIAGSVTPGMQASIAACDTLGMCEANLLTLTLTLTKDDKNSRTLDVCLVSSHPHGNTREPLRVNAGVWSRAQGAAPSEAWAALGGFLLATLLHWAAAKLKVGHFTLCS